MTSSSAPSDPTSPPPSHRRWRWILAGLLLALYFVTPPRAVMDQGLDSSNYGTYALFVAEGRQYGPEVIPMAGPLGFVLYGHTYAGELYYPRLILELLLKAGFAALLLHLATAARRRESLLLWGAAVLVMIPTVDDLLHDYALLLAGIILVRSYHGGSRGWALFAASFLGPLALLKGTQLVTASAIMTGVMVWGLWCRDRRTVLTQMIFFVGSLLLCWLAVGQNLSNLPAYVRNVLDLSSGYNATMGLDEAPLIQITGFALAAGLGAWILHHFWHSRRQPGVFAALLLVTFFSLIKWKHGFLRADGHVTIFFAAVVVLVPTIWMVAQGGWFGSSPPPPKTSQRLGLALASALMTWALISAADFRWHRLVGIGAGGLTSLPAQVAYVFQPGQTRIHLDEQLAENRRELDLPQIRNRVDADSIDFFGFEQGVLLLNHLNYQPRPMGGGTFNVFTQRLQQINAAHVRDAARASDWMLMKLGFLDDRYPAADDGLALRSILRGYSPLLMERDYLLLRRRQHLAPAPLPEIISESAIVLGQPVKVPPTDPNHLILFSLQSDLSLGGTLQKFFYRPPDMQIKVSLGGRDIHRTFALKPTTVQSPTILSPLLATNREIIDLYDDDTHGITVDTVTLLAEAGFDPATLRIRFYRVPRPLPPEETDIDEIRTYALHPLFNRPPTEYVSEETGIKELNDEEIRIVHAPGSITWELEPNDQQVIFNYGIMPQAYLADPFSDGVEFNLEVLWPDGDGRTLWQRMMRPATIEQDRGMQTLRFPLPPYQTGARLRIRTHPGPDNDGAFDQSYITRFQIKTGPLIGAQFSGLGVVPSNQVLPRDSVAGIADKSVYLLHAPNEVRVPLPHDAKTITLTSGLLPGAYTNGGNSDGVEFGVFLLRPGGEPEYLDGWLLNPRDHPAHIGPQIKTLKIPAAPPDTEIIIATNVGPRGDRGWDQSYIADIRFE